MTRLLVLASTYPARADDGTPRFVQDLARAEAEGFETLVVVPRVKGARRDDRDGAVRVRRYAYFPRRFETLADGAIIENLRARRSDWLQVLPLFAAQFFAVRRAVREFRPDVVHAHWIIPQGVIARLAARGVPMLLSSHGADLYALNAGPLRALKRWVVRAAGAITVMNADMRERMLALGAAESAVRIEPMGAYLPELPPRESAGEGPVQLVFLGRLVEKKGVHVLLEALRALPADAYRLTVAGDGPMRAELERLAAGLPVEFAGTVGRAEVARLYANADVVVVPSVPAASGDRDGLPVSLLEAMSAGSAIVASDVAGVNEAVADGQTALLVPPADASALADALRRVIADGELRRRLGEAAAERSAWFTVDAVGERYRAILAALVPRRSGAAQGR
ncbi:glycosyltransferase [Gryllotalpicola ginsengisoli]|uniref:glycosyltransferase n=1 Tax=Gryllotalpicola ginsengisoli TaxID=444608 RepID=UPI0003B5A233|nr:glycosyltransferase [Gryllotalpicola ginsengisoli]